MKIDIHCKGFDLTDAIRAHIEDKFGKLERILPGEADIVHFIEYETKSRGGLFTVKVSFHAWGTDIVTKEVNEDLYKAVTDLAESTFSQVRKVKEKQGSHRKGGETIRNYIPPAEPETFEDEEEDFAREFDNPPKQDDE